MRSRGALGGRVHSRWSSNWATAVSPQGRCSSTGIAPVSNSAPPSGAITSSALRSPSRHARNTCRSPVSSIVPVSWPRSRWRRARGPSAVLGERVSRQGRVVAKLKPRAGSLAASSFSTNSRRWIRIRPSCHSASADRDAARGDAAGALVVTACRNVSSPARAWLRNSSVTRVWNRRAASRMAGSASRAGSDSRVVNRRSESGGVGVSRQRSNGKPRWLSGSDESLISRRISAPLVSRPSRSRPARSTRWASRIGPARAFPSRSSCLATAQARRGPRRWPPSSTPSRERTGSARVGAGAPRNAARGCSTCRVTRAGPAPAGRAISRVRNVWCSAARRVGSGVGSFSRRSVCGRPWRRNA